MALIDIFYPRRCPICLDVLKIGKEICEECVKKIPRITEPVCISCGKPVRDKYRARCKNCQKYHRNYDGGICWSLYSNDYIRRFLSEVKYNHDVSLLDYPVKDFARQYEARIREWQIDCIVPVPIHKKRMRERGFNQAEEIAKRLSLLWNIPINSSVLTRVQSTIAQKELGILERDQNMKAVISLGEKLTGVQNVLLVDDIYTTGSTMLACKNALLSGGCKKVYIATLATSADEI